MIVKELYNTNNEYNDDEDLSGYLCNYDPIINSLGKVLVQKDNGNYSGDIWVLYSRYGAGYGILTFGWGSCSACDALQSCESWEDVQELYDDLQY